MLKMG